MSHNRRQTHSPLFEDDSDAEVPCELPYYLRPKTPLPLKKHRISKKSKIDYVGEKPDKLQKRAYDSSTDTDEEIKQPLKKKGMYGKSAGTSSARYTSVEASEKNEGTSYAPKAEDLHTLSRKQKGRKSTWFKETANKTTIKRKREHQVPSSMKVTGASTSGMSQSYKKTRAATNTQSMPHN